MGVCVGIFTARSTGRRILPLRDVLRAGEVFHDVAQKDSSETSTGRISKLHFIAGRLGAVQLKVDSIASLRVESAD